MIYLWCNEQISTHCINMGTLSQCSLPHVHIMTTWGWLTRVVGRRSRIIYSLIIYICSTIIFKCWVWYSLVFTCLKEIFMSESLIYNVCYLTNTPLSFDMSKTCWSWCSSSPWVGPTDKKQKLSNIIINISIRLCVLTAAPINHDLIKSLLNDIYTSPCDSGSSHSPTERMQKLSIMIK